MNATRGDGRRANQRRDPEVVRVSWKDAVSAHYSLRLERKSTRSQGRREGRQPG